MAASASKTAVINSDVVRAFADAMENGFVGSLNDFAASEDGQNAANTIATKKEAEMKSLRMGYARAVAKDFKVNGKLTTYSKDRAIALRDFLATVDFDAVTDPETATTDDAE